MPSRFTWKAAAAYRQRASASHQASWNNSLRAHPTQGGAVVGAEERVVVVMLELGLEPQEGEDEAEDRRAASLLGKQMVVVQP